MSHDHSALIAQLKESLTQQRYNPVVVQNHCHYATQFLHYLGKRRIAVELVTQTEVATYLRYAVRRFRKHYGRSPAPYWTSIPRSAIHGLLRRVQKCWPPEPVASGPGEALCRAVCSEYREWLSIERGLAVASVNALMWEARHFLSWYIERATFVSFMELTIQDIDAYFEMRAPGLRRKSLKDVAERIRSLVRYLHTTGRIPTDLAPQIIAPMLYAYETIPSALSPEQIAAVLKTAGEDTSPIGLRDFAILLLLSTYGMRNGEIRRLRLDDINWRAETLRSSPFQNRHILSVAVDGAGGRGSAQLPAPRTPQNRHPRDLHSHASSISTTFNDLQRGSPTIEGSRREAERQKWSPYLPARACR